MFESVCQLQMHDVILNSETNPLQLDYMWDAFDTNGSTFGSAIIKVFSNKEEFKKRVFAGNTAYPTNQLQKNDRVPNLLLTTVVFSCY